jgi:hypothetical protein
VNYFIEKGRTGKINLSTSIDKSQNLLKYTSTQAKKEASISENEEKKVDQYIYQSFPYFLYQKRDEMEAREERT